MFPYSLLNEHSGDTVLQVQTLVKTNTEEPQSGPVQAIVRERTRAAAGVKATAPW